MPQDSVGIIGGGAWGTALACAVHSAGHRACIYTKRGADAWRESAARTPGIRADDFPNITASSDDTRLRDCSVILYVGKAQELRDTLTELHRRGSLPTGIPLLICSKGIERDTGALLHETAAELLPADTPVCLLSGPNFAKEIARGLPAASVIAGVSEDMAERCADALRGPAFRIYLSTDMTGVALGGALKNVIAIACGMADGKHLGENARAGLITRALAELARLIARAGGDPATVYGLSGIGDMMLTCMSSASRNYSFGYAYISGTLNASERLTAEGTETAKAVMRIAERYGVDLPICSAVTRVLCDNSPFDAELRHLLDRPAGLE